MVARIYGAVNHDAKINDLANSYLTNHFATIGYARNNKNYPRTFNQLKKYITL